MCKTNLLRQASCVAWLSMAGLAGCGQDPLTRDGTWNPTHVNHQNLAAMVANPRDLVRGTGTTTTDGQLAATAIERLRTDKLKKLPASDVSTITVGNSGANNGSQSGAQ